MEEPFKKDLGFNITAMLYEDGILTLTEEDFDEEEGVETTRIALPPQAARALLNFLRREQSRERIGYRLWQKEGSSQE
jgi:hypothetical protein